jgi:hypothetical protein
MGSRNSVHRKFSVFNLCQNKQGPSSAPRFSARKVGDHNSVHQGLSFAYSNQQQRGGGDEHGRISGEQSRDAH